MFSKATLFTLSILFGQSLGGLLFTEVASQLPRDVTHIGIDETLGHYVAYKRDGTVYGRYVAALSQERDLQRRQSDASSCTNLTVDQAKTLPGWDKLNTYADDTWGTGSRNIVTNPDDYPDSPALVCVSDEVVPLQYTGTPNCQTQNSTLDGGLVGTSGIVTLEVDTGSTASSSFSVSKSSSLAVSSTTSVTLGLSRVAEVGEAVTVSTNFTNEQTKSFSASYSHMSKAKVTIHSDAGKECNLIMSVKSCTSQATGSVKYLASGWVWFNYNDKTKGHYKWAASIESVLTDEDDRSSVMEFKGSINADTTAHYQGTCS